MKSHKKLFFVIPAVLIIITIIVLLVIFSVIPFINDVNKKDDKEDKKTEKREDDDDKKSDKDGSGKADKDDAGKDADKENVGSDTDKDNAGKDDKDNTGKKDDMKDNDDKKDDGNINSGKETDNGKQKNDPDAGKDPVVPEKEPELIKVGVINNPPNESGYREKNVRDMEQVFSKENGYDLKTFYSHRNSDQLQAAESFISDGVDYLLISAMETTGWDDTLIKAKEKGIKVYLFDRMIDVDPNLYEAAIMSDMAKEGEAAVNWLQTLNLAEYRVIHIQGAMGSDAQIGRTAALNAQFMSGKMTCVCQMPATWDETTAKNIVKSVINSGEFFNVIYAENDGMAKGAVEALDEAGITHGVNGQVIIIGFDCNKWALRELQAGKWNYDGQCSPFHAQIISDLIRGVRHDDSKIIIVDETGFDARTITQDDVDRYGLGD